MKLLNKEDMSDWAYFECKNGNDNSEIRKLITKLVDVYCYCRDVRDIKEMWSRIKDPDWAFWYCRIIKNRPEVRKYIK